MEMFQSYLMENSPLGPERNAIILQHLLRYMEEGSEYFMKFVSNELEIQNTLKGELEQKLSTKLEEMKTTQLKEKEAHMKKIQQLSAESAQTQAKEQMLREKCEALKNEKQG